MIMGVIQMGNNKRAIGAIANIRFHGVIETEMQTFAFGSYDEETETNSSLMSDEDVFFYVDDEKQLIELMEQKGEDFTVQDYKLIYANIK